MQSPQSNPSCTPPPTTSSKYVELAMIVARGCEDDELFNCLACAVTFNADHSNDLRAIIDKLDVNKVGSIRALGMDHEPSPYDINEIADCVIELFVLEYAVTDLANVVEIHSPPTIFDFDN